MLTTTPQRRAYSEGAPPPRAAPPLSASWLAASVVFLPSEMTSIHCHGLDASPYGERKTGTKENESTGQPSRSPKPQPKTQAKRLPKLSCPSPSKPPPTLSHTPQQETFRSAMGASGARRTTRLVLAPCWCAQASPSSPWCNHLVVCSHIICLLGCLCPECVIGAMQGQLALTLLVPVGSRCSRVGL